MSWNIDNCIPKPFSDALVGLCKVEVELDPVLQNHWAVHLLVTNGKNVFIILRTIKKMLTTPFNVYNDVDADYEIVNGGFNNNCNYNNYNSDTDSDSGTNDDDDDNDNEQLDEVEHDITNNQNQDLSYLPKAEAENTDTRVHNLTPYEIHITNRHVIHLLNNVPKKTLPYEFAQV